MAQRPLIGTSPNQVSTNGMLGDLAFQDSTGAYIETIRGAVNLDKLDKEITDTAVDIFVYDTRKDSDGGAWRKRTQHTSWYNETLNTATRGSRREFPAVAVIVSTLTTVTIYDGDDPDLPMWMVFLGSEGGMSSQRMVQYINQQGYYLHALNGILVIGHKSNADNYGSPIIRFISEYVNRMDPQTGSEGGVWNGTIADRNSTSGYRVSSTETYGIVNSVINDVAMTVLPNAPIDPSTGLPVPTIAVATDGGVSVIKDDGTVVDITWISYGVASSVYFKDNYLWLTNDGSIFNKGGRYLKKYSIPSSNISESHGYLRNSALKYWASPWGFLGSYTGTSYPPILGSYSGFYGPTVGPYWGSSDGTNGGITFIGDEGTTTTNGMVAYATTSYNTGWMHGDIKGAFLSDTDATNVTGTELWPEGDFADANEWSSAGVQWTISGGTATVNYTGGGYSFLGSSTATLTNGKKYVLSFTVSNYSGGRLEASQANSSNIPIGFSANGSYTQLITYTGSTGYGLGMYAYGGGTVNFTLDNLFLRELEEEDRSVNNTGLAVYGTITKTPVATGADLVAYSGFSASTNYLKQPFNSDLAIGNSDFSSVGWFKKSTSSNTSMILYANDGANQTFDVRVHTDLKMLAQITDDAFTTREIVSAQGPTVNDNIWHQYHVVRRSNVLHLYLDGNLLGTSAAIEANITNSLSTVIGVESLTANQKAFQGSLSLIRFSKSAPTPEQIKKIYNDEKVLFQENAKCTLYGSSDAVTALAYDDDNQLLHVGTSSGRSDFQGLRRINNTTTAVTTAISASNGLIAEQ